MIDQFLFTKRRFGGKRQFRDSALWLRLKDPVD
jgi:hypothetical protein